MPNQLFYGDNLEVLRKHIKDESVDLCYIDPPFNSKRNYNQIYNNIGKEDHAQAQAFIDTWTWDDYANLGLAEIQENYLGRFTSQSIDLISGLTKVLGKGSLLAYLISMTLRIAEIHRVLKPTGSFYLHCDPTASHYLKIIIDAIFCAKGGDFINEIIWCYDIGGRISQKALGRRHDVVFLYTKNKQYTFNWQDILDDFSDSGKAKFKYEDEHGKYRLMGRFLKDSPIKGHRDVSPEWEKKNPELVYRHYLKDGKMQVDYWNISPINQASRERLGYPTQKPEALLERIIKASSNEGDVVLDAYCGCGTTVAVSQRLNRKWIGIDITYQSISLILKRLEDAFGKGVFDNLTISGIPKDIESAQALALKKDDRTRKEFEKWAVLTYSNNRAVIQQKKGKDQGIDGIAYFMMDSDNQGKIIFQVKSGNVKSGDIRDLIGTVSNQEAQIGIFITLKSSTNDMVKTAKSAGIFQSPFMSHPVDKIQIVTVQEMIEEQKRLDIQLSLEVLKSAEKQKEVKHEQLEIEQ